MFNKKGICFVFLLCLSLVQIANAGVRVSNNDSPIFISSHVMGGQVIQYPNGNYSMMGLITGFAVDKFPYNVAFQTSTNFISTIRYKPALSAIVLSDASGKATISRYEFDMKFERAGAVNTQIVDWKISFPVEGFYAYNIFIDGVLVGYYPFYVWLR